MTTAPSTPTAPMEADPGNQAGKEKARLSTKASRQRFKPQLSCTLCRARKMKCDRSIPCENCIKRDLASSCTYIHAGLRDKSSSIHKASTGQKDPKDVQGRVRHLEELVVSLMHQSKLKNAAPQSDLRPGLENGVTVGNGITTERSDLRETSDSFGRISIEDEQPNYVGAGHWAAILDSIAGLKDSLDDNARPDEPEPVATPDSQGVELLTGSVPKATKAEILAALPPRSVTDPLMKRLYSTADFIPCIHLPTFEREYENFWANPSATPVMWIGLLFSSLTITLYLELVDPSGDASSLADQPLRDPLSTIKIFREKIAQCLILGNYTEPTTYTVETLLMYFFIEHFRTPSSHMGAWMLVGIIVRAAMRLGYHRDARHSPTISVLQGEMQRRIWATVAHMDLQTSCSVGLPRMVKEGMFDTEPPRNLLDDDFDEHTKVLPPSRPYEEATPSTHPLLKHAVTRVYGMIVDETSSTGLVSYEEIMRLDGLLEEAHNQVPDFLEVRSVEDLKIGKPETVLQKFSVDLCYQRARCVLHRNYLVPQKSSTSWRYSYSVKACVDAAMQILHSQSFLCEETKPKRRLHDLKWKISSLMTHDFLLAAMLICVHLKNNGSGKSFAQNANLIRWTREEMLQALDIAYRIWDEASRSSKDALKAAKALKRTLASIKGARANGAAQTQSPAGQTSSSSYGLSFSERIPQAVQTSSSSSAATDDTPPWMMASSIPQSYQPAEQGAFEASFGGTEDMINPPMEFDWELWDSHFHNNLEDSPPDLWDFDAGTFAFPGDNENIMEWGH